MNFVELNSVTRTLLFLSVGMIREYLLSDEQGQLLALRTAKCFSLAVYSVMLSVLESVSYESKVLGEL
jgi:hypothetical protein